MTQESDTIEDKQAQSRFRPFILWALFLGLCAILVAGVAGWLDPVERALSDERLSFSTGDFTITAYMVARVIVVLALVYWMAAVVAGVLDTRIRHAKAFKSGTRSLIAQIVRIAIYIIAGLITLDVVGLDLTALTVFGGALGIGLGFGLQKIASNFISGIILMVERSVEEDDLVELADGTTGFVRRTSARYVLLETFDGKDILIPNEELITGRVINWTLTNSRGRVEIKVGVAYGSDLHLAQSLMLDAAKAHPLCIEDPAPVCVLRTFGDSAIDFTLWFWVADVTKGRMGPQSEVMFAIVDLFEKHGVRIPFPQRDLHIMPGATNAIEPEARS
ncbi:mechanosensitive ion channel family protein [Oceanicaulis sp. LC35]|uniref:mechanosensitive ion channel family protein n=1 Tax=Oceanicaulis sp. LC35 TaxID=3349635 RepID=UPI003F87E171